MGAKVPSPTWRVTWQHSAPRQLMASRRVGVKCRPAVGAATEPGWRAYMVW